MPKIKSLLKKSICCVALGASSVGVRNSTPPSVACSRLASRLFEQTFMRHVTHYVFFTLFWTSLFLPVAMPAEAAIDYLKVIDVSGRADVVEGGQKAPAKLRALKKLSPLMSIRTYPGSYVELSTSFDHSCLIKIDSDSRLRVMSSDFKHFFVESGAVWILREDDPNGMWERAKDPDPIKIKTPQGVIELTRGGISLNIGPESTQIRVFSESAKILMDAHLGSKPYARVVEEGYKLLIEESADAQLSGPARMDYNDYAQWQTWVRRCYERKDGRLIDIFEKQGIR